MRAIAVFDWVSDDAQNLGGLRDLIVPKFILHLTTIVKATKWSSLPEMGKQLRSYQFQPRPCGRPHDKIFSMSAD